MKLNWKTIGIAVGALIGAVVLALVLFFVFFPKDLAVREAERRIEEATGRDLTLGDDVQISIWPALGFSVNDATLSNPEGFDNAEPFLAAERIVFAVKVLPLLRGAVEVKQLIFERASFNLAAKEDGAANWTFPTEQNTPGEQTTLEDLRLDDVRLIDSRVSFLGADGGQPLVLEDVDAALSLQSLDAPAQLDAAFDYRGERLDIESEIGLPRAVLEKGQTPLSARLEAEPLSARFDGAFNAADGALTGALEADGASVRRLAAWMGSPMGEGGGFNAFRLAAQMAHAADTTELTDLVLRVDDADLRGALSLITQDSGKLRITGALNAARIDLNSYLPAPAQGAEQGGGVQVNAEWPTTPLDLSGLRALDANLNLTLGALQFQRMSFTDVALNLRVSNGAADARLSRIALYQGAGTARLIADASGAIPRIAVELNADNVQAEPLLRDAIGFDRIAGRGRITASLIGHGRSQAEIMRSLRGAAAFNFNDGQWKGVNLAQVARTIQSALTGRTSGPGGATDFAELSASFAVDNGVMATDNLALLNPFVRLDGQGVINIGMQSIDMRIAPRAVRSMEGQGGNAALAGIGVPFRVSGPWSHVGFAPALGGAVEDELRARAQNILRRQDQNNPLTQLGETLFGVTPEEAPAAEAPPAGDASTPADSGAATTTTEPPPQRPEDRARDALGGLLRDALGGNRTEEKQEPAPTPAPTP
ncbi:MAG: AsmA family protein [Hyphomonadaceae bacterium]|nr:AsmA family protein [Hyphomonadaceae bacterium]